MNIEDRIREGIVLRDQPHSPIYRGIFYDGNLHIYKFVKKGEPFNGNTFKIDVYYLAWSERMTSFPSVVPAQRGESV